MTYYVSSGTLNSTNSTQLFVKCSTFACERVGAVVKAVTLKLNAAYDCVALCLCSIYFVVASLLQNKG